MVKVKVCRQARNSLRLHPATIPITFPKAAARRVAALVARNRPLVEADGRAERAQTRGTDMGMDQAQGREAEIRLAAKVRLD